MLHNVFDLASLQQDIIRLEIIDTAVKVGLGALISGFSAYFVTRLQYKGNIEQERRRRKAEILQESAEQLENVYHVYLKYAALTKDVLKIQREGLEISNSKQKEREQVKAELFNIFRELTNAEAKLMLIGEMRLGELVREFGDKLTAFRRKVVIKDDPLSDSEIDGLKDDILITRKELFTALADSYRRI